MIPSAARRVAHAALIALALVGCRVRLMAPYDPVLEQGVTQIATDVSAFLTLAEAVAGTPDSAYRQHIPFYAKTQGALRVLRLGSEKEPNSERVISQLDGIGRNLQRLRERHKASGDEGLAPDYLQTARAAFDVQFTSFFTLTAEMRRDR